MKSLTPLVLLLAALIPTPLQAGGNPHFVGPVSAQLQGNNVRVCWKEAGLGNNLNINYTASANATATYVCVNNGGNCPSDPKKTTVAGPVSASGTFSSGQNGTINACLTISPPGAGGFSCPGGQTAVLAEVSYSNIAITDTTNNVSKTASPSSLSRTVFTCR